MLTQTMGGTKQRVALALTGLILFAFVVKAFHPGYMSFDSASQLTEARAGIFTDWHPPLLSFFWRWLDKLYPGPFLMLALFVGLYVAGSALLISAIGFSVGASVIALVGFVLFPPILALLSTIWKDVALGGLLLCATGCLAQKVVKENPSHRRYLWLAFAFLFLAVGVRHNAILAVFPFLAFVVYLATKSVASFWLRLALFFVVFGFATTTIHFANRALTAGQTSYPIQQIFLHDLVAISLATHQNLLPRESFAEASPPSTVEGLKPLYSETMVVPLFNQEKGPVVLVISKDANLVKQISKNWIHAVFSHPGAYWHHRWAMFKNQMAVGTPEVCYPLHSGIDASAALGIQFHPSRTNDRVHRYLNLFTRSWLFRGWFYLFCLAALLGIWIKYWRNEGSEYQGLIFTLLVSGLLYGLPYFFVGTTCDFRMHWWCVIATLAAVTLSFRRPTTKVNF